MSGYDKLFTYLRQLHDTGPQSEPSSIATRKPVRWTPADAHVPGHFSGDFDSIERPPPVLSEHPDRGAMRPEILKMLRGMDELAREFQARKKVRRTPPSLLR